MRQPPMIEGGLHKIIRRQGTSILIFISVLNYHQYLG